MNRKRHFLIFLAIFKSHFLSRIPISEKNSFAQHFLYIKLLIWLHSCPLLKILTYPNGLSWTIMNDRLSIFFKNTISKLLFSFLEEAVTPSRVFIWKWLDYNWWYKCKTESILQSRSAEKCCGCSFPFQKKFERKWLVSESFKSYRTETCEGSK